MIGGSTSRIFWLLIRLIRVSRPGWFRGSSRSTYSTAVSGVVLGPILSPIGFDKKQKAVVTGMGLRRIGYSVELPDTAATRGMILKVRHLVEVGDNS